MNYPNDFNVPSFPAGKTVAFSRVMAIWISILFFLIIAACGFILLGQHLKKNYPFLISVDPFTGEWSVVTYPGKSEKEKIQQYQIIQEKLVRDFVVNWFTISIDNSTNEERWEKCSIEECAKPEQFNPTTKKCAISCKSNDVVFNEFNENVLPEYRELVVARNSQWNVASMLITPIKVNEQSSQWQIYATIVSSVTGPFNVLAFITTAQSADEYPSTLGYHITTFNAYRIANE